jgi:hypothetical protein
MLIGAFLSELPVPESDLQKRVLMTAIASKWDVSIPLRTPDFSTSFENDQVVVRGVGSGKPWRAVLPPAGRGLWRTEKGGFRTYYFAGYTGASGIAAPTWILALTFGADGPPRPFYVVGHAAYDDGGIKDLLQLDSNGPYLVHQNWCHTDWDRSEIGAQSGLIITSLYEQRNGYWFRSDGQRGLLSYPIAQQWSRWSRKPPTLVNWPSVPNKCITDHGNNPARGIQVRISKVSKYHLETSTDVGCPGVIPGVVVRDAPKVRQIEVQDGETGQLLREVAEGNKEVVLSGIDRSSTPDYCRAAVVWSTGR